MSFDNLHTHYSGPLAGVATRLAGLTGAGRVIAAFFCGGLSLLAFAPLHIWPVLFLTLPAFIWLLDGVYAQAQHRSGKQVWRQAALTGWCFGFGFFSAGLYWIGFAFFVEADKFAMLAPLGVAAFPAALALFYAFAAALAIRFWRNGVARIFIFTASFFVVEWLRGHILTGFPWNLWGYALAGNNALAQLAALFGLYGLTLLTLLICSSPAALGGRAVSGKGRGWLLPAFCLLLLLTGWGCGTLRLNTATDDHVAGVNLRIVQGNIPQADKWKPENRQWIFDRLMKLSAIRAGENPKPTHIIWPETAVPVLFMLNDKIHAPDVRDALAELVPPDTTLILGAERVEGTRGEDGRYQMDRIYNSLFVLDDSARVQEIYDKVHLVPFGEYLPFEPLLTGLGIKQLTHVNSGFTSGSERPLITTPAAPPFLPLICYEVIFPDWLSKAGGRPGWLLNLTNDAWFGVTSGPHQHLHQARMRAIEEGLPVIRAANTGISAIIDGYGRIRESLPLGGIGKIDAPLPVALSPTLYARWRAVWLILLAIVTFLLYRLAIKVE